MFNTLYFLLNFVHPYYKASVLNFPLTLLSIKGRQKGCLDAFSGHKNLLSLRTPMLPTVPLQVQTSLSYNVCRSKGQFLQKYRPKQNM